MHSLTFDIEEWFHILDCSTTKGAAEWSKYEYRLDENLDRILSLLEKHDQKATFFCLGWIARIFPKAIREIVDRGHEIASHSDMHQLAFEQDVETFRADLDQSIKCLEDATGVKIRAYRAPGFSLQQKNKWVFGLTPALTVILNQAAVPNLWNLKS